MLTEEEHQLLERIRTNCELLYGGYEEKVEYKVKVAYHRNLCVYYTRSNVPKDDCECPVTDETRVRKIRRPSLIDQLKDFTGNKDTDRNPKAERGAPRIKVAGRPPGDMAGFFTLDEIMTDIFSVVDKALEEAERDRTWASQPAKLILAGLSGQVGYFVQGRPDLARTIDKAASKWVANCRSTLKITVGDSIFDSVVCGNCQGGLSTPWGNRGESDVKCIGTPSTPPCGETYPMTEWISLYEDHQRRVRREQQS